MTTEFDKIKMQSEKQATEIYGKTLSPFIRQRLNQELEYIRKTDIAKSFLLAEKVIKEINEMGYETISRGTTASSFVLFSLGITDINPLPAHYLCPECSFHEFIPEETCGIDLINKKCPICGKELRKEGFTLMPEFFTGVSRLKKPQLCFFVPPEAYDVICNKPEVSTEEETEPKAIVIDKLTDLVMLKNLEDCTNVKSKSIPLDDEATFDLLKSGNLSGIQFFSNIAEINSFDDIIRICGLSKGDGTLNEFTQKLLENNSVSFRELISTREDVMQTLIKYGVTREKAFDITETVRKGLVKHYNLDVLSQHGLPFWFSESCRKISYLHPRSHITELALLLYRFSYYEKHFPKQFECICSEFKKRNDFKFIGGKQNEQRNI